MALTMRWRQPCIVNHNPQISPSTHLTVSLRAPDRRWLRFAAESSLPSDPPFTRIEGVVASVAKQSPGLKRRVVVSGASSQPWNHKWLNPGDLRGLMHHAENSTFLAGAQRRSNLLSRLPRFPQSTIHLYRRPSDPTIHIVGRQHIESVTLIFQLFQTMRLPETGQQQFEFVLAELLPQLPEIQTTLQFPFRVCL
jgi:hypothetical protein